MWFVLLALSFVARAQDPEPRWYLGLPIAAVTLEGPEGGLPEERLDPLLRSVAGDPLNPDLIRLDLTTLFRVGGFQAVQADVRPSVIQNEDGDFEEAVQITYQLYPSPKLSKIRIEGGRDFSDREMIEVSGLHIGDTFYEGIDDPRTEVKVRQWLRTRGYRSADLEVEVDAEGTQLEVTLHIEEGDADILDRLAIVGNLKGLPGGRMRARRTIKRWAKQEGVKVGEALPPASILNAQQRIRSNLASMQGQQLRRPWRRIGSRVTPALVTTDKGQLRLTYTVEPGPALYIDTQGLVWGKRKAANVLGIDERLRLTRGFLEDAPERMKQSLQERGFLDAQVTVNLIDARAGQSQTLSIDIDKGPRHRLPRGQFPEWVGIEFTGNEAITIAELQAVFDQTSPDVIRRDWYTEPELKRGIGAAEELYRTRGYQSAELDLTETQVRASGTPLGRFMLIPFRWVTGNLTPKTVTPTVRVHEGAQTLLESIEIVGADPEVDLPEFEAYRDTHIGAPYSPQQHQALAQYVTEQHRAAGYLDTSVRVVAPTSDEVRVRSTLAVNRGPKVLLRSAVVRGAQRTKEAFLQNEMDLTLGEPLSSSELARLRTDLYALGIFQNIQINVIGDGQTRDLILHVREHKRWAFEIGTGLSTDQGVRTFGRASRRNLWGLAHRLDLIGQIGVDYSTDTLIDYQNIAQNLEGRAAIEYTAPRFIGRPHTLILDALIRERLVERTWEIARSGGGAALDTRVHAKSQLRTAARLEYRQLQEVEASALLEGEPWLVYLEEDADLPSPARVHPVLSAFFVHDSRANRIQSRLGHVASLRTEYVPLVQWPTPFAERDLQSPPVEFLKAEARLGSFLPLGATTLHLSSLGGHARTLSRSPVPLEDRFVLGGTGSMRGFARNTLGPRNLGARVDIDWPDAIAPVIEYTVRDDPDRWAPTGGDTYAMATVEWLIPWTSLGMKSWDGYSTSLFVDAGNVWLFNTPASVSSQAPKYANLIPAVRLSSGIGLRIDSPVGPLQFDLASNLQTLGQSERARFLRTDWEEVPFRVHLALGALL